MKLNKKEAKLPTGRGQIGNIETVVLDYARLLKSKTLVFANVKKVKSVKNAGTDLRKNKKRKVSAKHERFGYYSLHAILAERYI